MKAVDHRRAAGCRRAEEGAAHRREVEAADLAEHIHDVVPIRGVHFDGAADDGLFSSKSSRP
jgi:hypothetical protein